MNSSTILSQLLCVDGEYFDPYYILQVTKDDTTDTIARVYRKKARKYHPDKAPRDKVQDYTRKFKIVTMAYEHISKQRRESVYGVSSRHSPQLGKFTQNHKNYLPTSEDVSHEKGIPLESTDKYTEALPIKNVFVNKKFQLQDFNQYFEHQKSTHTGENPELQLIHKTTDGFYGYNASDLNECALVCSFNGLMLSGDYVDDFGKGYFGSNYADVRAAFNSAQNPDRQFDRQVIPQQTPTQKKQHGVTGPKHVHHHTTFKESLVDLQQSFQHSLEDQLNVNKHILSKHAPQEYQNADIVQAAENRQLEMSPSLLAHLKDHYTVRLLK